MTVSMLFRDETMHPPIDLVMDVCNALSIDPFMMMSYYGEGKQVTTCDLWAAIKHTKCITYRGRVVDRNKLVKLLDTHLSQFV